MILFLVEETGPVTNRRKRLEPRITRCRAIARRPQLARLITSHPSFDLRNTPTFRVACHPRTNLRLLLQYSPFVRDAYAEIGHLPEELKQRFRAAVIEPGAHHQAKAIGAGLLDEHHKRMSPFDSAEGE